MRFVLLCLCTSVLAGCAMQRVYYNDKGEKFECKHYVTSMYDVGATDRQMLDCEREAKAKGFDKL